MQHTFNTLVGQLLTQPNQMAWASRIQLVYGAVAAT